MVGPPLQWQQPHQVVTPTVRSGEALRYRTVIRARWGGSYATTGTQWLDRLDTPTLHSRFTRGLEGRNLRTGTPAWRSVEVTLVVPEDVASGRYRLRSNFSITDTLLGIRWRTITVILVTEPFTIVAQETSPSTTPG